MKCTFAGAESHYFAVGQRKVGLEARFWTDDAPLQRWTLKVQSWAAIVNGGGEHCTNYTPDRPDTEDGDEKVIASVEVPYGATPAFGDTADNEIYHDYGEQGHSYQWRPTWLVEFRNPDGTLAVAAQEYPRSGYTQKTLERRWVKNYFDTPMCGHGRGERWLDDEYMYVYRQVANWALG